MQKFSTKTNKNVPTIVSTGDLTQYEDCTAYDGHILQRAQANTSDITRSRLEPKRDGSAGARVSLQRGVTGSVQLGPQWATLEACSRKIYPLVTLSFYKTRVIADLQVVGTQPRPGTRSTREAFGNGGCEPLVNAWCKAAFSCSPFHERRKSYLSCGTLS